jgi:hypothetical protein
MSKRVMANYYGHEIIVDNTWFRGAKLYIDGNCRDENHEVFTLAKDTPKLMATMDYDGQSHRVEVFFRALMTVEIKICVDGKQIGGEIF